MGAIARQKLCYISFHFLIQIFFTTVKATLGRTETDNIKQMTTKSKQTQKCNRYEQVIWGLSIVMTLITLTD
jgi:hypothetical protein